MANGSIKGITIEFRGDTTSLGKALSDVNKEIKATESSLKEVDKALKLDPDNVELLAQREALLNDEIAKTEEKLQLQKRAAEEAADALEKGTITQAEYAKLTAQLVTTENKLESLKNEANGSADALDNAGDEAEEAGDEAKKAGDKAADSGDKWEKLGNAAKVACEAAAAAVAAVTGAVVALGGALVDCTVDAAAFADDVLTTSQVTGMTTDEIQALQYSAELLDTSLETISGSMARNIRSMQSAADGTGDIAAAYEQLGVSVTDSAGNLRDSESVYWEAIDALGTIEDRTERDALAMQIFGKSAQELNPLIAAGSDEIARLAQEAEDVGYVMDGDTLDAFGAFDDELQRVKAGTTAAKNAIGTILLPVLTNLAGDGVDLLSEFTNGILDANGDIEQMSAVIETILPEVLALFTSYLPMIIELGGTIIETLANSIIENLPTILESAIELILTISEGIIDHLSDLAPVITTLVVSVANFIVDNLPTIISAALDLVIALADGISRALPELIPSVIECINQIVTTLIDHSSELVPAALELMIALALGLIAAIPEILNTVPQIVSEMSDEFDEYIPDLIAAAQTWGLDLVSNFISGITSSFGNLRSTLSSMASTVDSYIGFSVPDRGPLAEWAYNNPGADMIDLFTEGMNSEERALQRALVQTGDLIYNGMTPDYSGELGAISGALGNLGVNKSNGTYIININVGSQRLAQAVISAEQMEAYRTGGL